MGGGMFAHRANLVCRGMRMQLLAEHFAIIMRKKQTLALSRNDFIANNDALAGLSSFSHMRGCLMNAILVETADMSSGTICQHDEPIFRGRTDAVPSGRCVRHCGARDPELPFFRRESISRARVLSLPSDHKVILSDNVLELHLQFPPTLRLLHFRPHNPYCQNQPNTSQWPISPPTPPPA